MKSLYGKFILITIAIMMTSTLLSFLAVNTYYHQYLKAENDEKNMKVALQIASYIESADTLDLQHYLQTQAATGYKIFIVDDQTHSTQFGEKFRVNNLSDTAIRQVLHGETYHGMRDLPSETFVTGFFSDELANTVGVPFNHNDQQFALFLRPDIKMLFTEVHIILAGMVILMFVMSLIAMLFFAKKLIDPITELTLATQRVGEEEFTGTLHIHRRDEIGQLAESFQQMTKKLKENDQLRKEFISDVSHDFQTPLLNIKGYAELLLDHDLSDENREGYAKVIHSETERLSSLTKQLLLLTSLDQLSSPLNKKNFDLDEQLKDVVRKLRWLLEEKEMSLSMDLDEVQINGDPAFLEKVWENLLSNALKYTQPGGVISVQLINEETMIKVIVQDNGMGIDAAVIPRIFDRFYRVDESRGQEGTGLGLSIVQQVVKIHQGSIVVSSQKGVGTTFTVQLPKL